VRKFGLIGFPLSHSFSVSYFAEKFEREGLTDCTYENFPVEHVGMFSGLLASNPELCGLNVTIPYKSAIIPYLGYVSDEAAGIGAVNVIKIGGPAGKPFLRGFNSDITGIYDTLAPLAGKIRKCAIVLGTGGSSLAVRYVLAKMDFEIISVSRHPEKGNLTYDTLTPSVIKNAGLIVNTTPLGMYPDILSYPGIDYSALTDEHVLFDLVYNPAMTTFLSKGKEMGARITGGIKMLHSQAERAWEIWNDETL
jgi:shikimate dehydrogenase